MAVTSSATRRVSYSTATSRMVKALARRGGAASEGEAMADPPAAQRALLEAATKLLEREVARQASQAEQGAAADTRMEQYLSQMETVVRRAASEP